MVCMADLMYYNPNMGTLVEYSWGAVEDFIVVFFIPTLAQIQLAGLLLFAHGRFYELSYGFQGSNDEKLQLTMSL